MPNSIGPTGIITKTRSELVTFYTNAYQSIYGADINLESDTPDGQMMNIQIQAILDLQDLLVQINAGFDPDQAIGAILDQRVAINGIQRQAGTFTLTNVTITNDRSINLAGLDAAINDPNGTGYTVQDNAGNKWILAASQVSLSAGSHVLQFRAQNSGAVLTVPNTITIPFTVVLGVTSVNNPTTYTSLGLTEETDSKLRIRRQKSVSLASQGYADSLRAALANIFGVSASFVYENNTDSTDGSGVPSHSIWAIVNGGSAADIANAIYKKRGGGEGMKGSQTHTITQDDGSPFVVKWDNVVSEDLYIKFNATSMNGDSIDTANIATQLVLMLTPGVNEPVNINELATLVQDIDPNVLVTGAGFSTSSGGSYTNTLAPTNKNYQFAVSAVHIAITVV